MTTEEAVRALADLSEVDLRLSGRGALTPRAARSLEGRREALREAIPGNFLAAYDDLGRAGRRPAVVALVRGAHCGGCYMRVPPQLEGTIRRGQSLHSCPHCRRLLFAPVPAAESRDESAPEHGPAKVASGKNPGKGTLKVRKPRAIRAEKKSRPT